MISTGADYILVPSARKLNGQCVPVFKCAVARVDSVLKAFDVFWDGTNAYIDDGVERDCVVIDNVYGII